MCECIHTITMLERLKKNELGLPDTGDTRCVGFHFTIESADKTVRANLCDISEAGTYRYAIVEACIPGICNGHLLKQRRLYKYNAKKHTYEQIDEPKWLRNFCGFGIG